MTQLSFDTRIISNSVRETEKLAAELYRRARPDAVIALIGPLGAGKTTFVRGVAKAAGCNADDVSSPSFTLINEYLDGETPLYHFDLYRIGNPDEFYAIGGDDYLGRSGIILIEWPENGEGYIPEKRIEIHIDIVDAKKRGFAFRQMGI